MKRFIIITFIIVIAFILSSCASIVSKSKYPVNFNSNPQGAEVIVKDVRTGQNIYTGKTPCTVVLSSKGGFFSPARYSVVFKKDRIKPQTVSLEANLDGWYIGNLLFGGLIGLLIVDPATGAMWKLPDGYTADLSKETALLLNYSGKSLQIMFYEEFPQEFKTSLIKIN